MTQEAKEQKTAGAHFGLCVSTEARARALFEELFEMPPVKEFEAPADLIESLFGRNEGVKILVYKAGCVDLEVFVAPPQTQGGYEHLCLTVADRPDVMERAQSMGLGVSSHAKPDGAEIVFIKDLDGNLYEIKQQ